MQTVTLSPNYLTLDHGLDRLFELVLASALPDSDAAAKASVESMERKTSRLQEVAMTKRSDGSCSDSSRRLRRKCNASVVTQ